MKGYSAFPKARGLKVHHQMHFSVISRTLIGSGSDRTAEIQSMYSTVPPDWAEQLNIINTHLCTYTYIQTGSVQKVLSLTQMQSESQKCPGNVNPFQLALWRQHFWDFCVPRSRLYQYTCISGLVVVVVVIY